MNKLILLIVFILLSTPTHAYAKTGTARQSAKLISMTLEKKADNRIEILKKFLTERNSPLAPYASTFITEADKNNLDWKLVAAISGNESQFGELIPPYSNNGWGYGVYGGNVHNFTTWNEGIVTVSKALRENYIEKWGATTIYEIGAIYAEDPNWANKVNHYIGLIENYQDSSSKSSISISL